MPGTCASFLRFLLFFWTFFVGTVDALHLRAPASESSIAISGAVGQPLDFPVGSSCLCVGFWPWGEALNPGPSGDDCSLLSVGVTNPSGLRGKEEQAVSLGPGIWNFAETQLSHVTQRSCSSHLRSMARLSGRDLRVHMGEPVVPRANSTWAGTWSGVCSVSDFPSREVALTYRGERSCGRILTTQHFVHQISLLVGTVYGYPKGPTWPQARKLTEDLVSVLTQELVLGSSGPRIICGDFNCHDTELEAFKLWHRMGWRSAQDYANEVWDQPRVMTCKSSTEPDMVWNLSPCCIRFKCMMSSWSTLLFRLTFLFLFTPVGRCLGRCHLLSLGNRLTLLGLILRLLTGWCLRILMWCGLIGVPRLRMLWMVG